MIKEDNQKKTSINFLFHRIYVSCNASKIESYLNHYLVIEDIILKELFQELVLSSLAFFEKADLNINYIRNTF